MTAQTHPVTTAGLNRWWIFVAVALGLLLSACVADALPGVPDTSAGDPAVLDQSIADLTSEIDIPPATVPTVSEPVPASTPPPITRGVLSVVQQDEFIELRLGDRVHFAGTGWTIRFARVLEDSRCPVDVQCVWAGQVVVRLLGEHSDGRVAALMLTLGPSDGGTGLLGDLPLEAAGVGPPRRGGSPPSEEYTLRLRVSSPADATPRPISGLRGMVTLGPMCPVVRLDQPCPDRPYSATLVVRDMAGRLVTRVTSGADGAFILPLPVGAYVLESDTSASRLPSTGSYRFTVEPDHWTTLEVRFDTGIR